MRLLRLLPMVRALAPACALLAVMGLSPALAAPTKVAGGIRFTYVDRNASSVNWAGEFNAWNATANPLQKGSDGTWSIVLALPPGTHAYKFVVDGQWFADPENPVTAGEYGNSVVTVGADGAMVAQQATSNTPYSPKLFIGGRVIGLYLTRFNPAYSRYELRRPDMDIDLATDIRFSDVMGGRFLMNINPQNEDVQDYRSRLNFKRGSLHLTDKSLELLAYDSEIVGTWDDPLRLVGDIGVFHHGYGFQRQGFVARTNRSGFEIEAQYSDNFEVGGTEFPDFALNRGTNRVFVFETDPTAKAQALLRTEPVTGGFHLASDQFAKVQSTDVGDNGNAFGFGDGNENVFAARVRRRLPGDLRVGLLGRSDRGFNLGRLVLAQPTGDSSVSVTSALTSQEWFGVGMEAQWSPSPTHRLYAEYLQGARRMTFVTGTVTDFQVTAIGATGVTTAQGAQVVTDGDHLTTDRSSRTILGGDWMLADGDAQVGAAIEYQRHSYPSWTQSPIIPAGLPPDDHPLFENVDYQRAQYDDATDDLDNSMVVLHVTGERNWRYYLGREVRTGIDLEWTNFDYDRRTSWEYQMWFPTGNFWLESGQSQVSIDRLTALGADQVLRLVPSLEVPFWYARGGLFRWQGTFSWADSGSVSLGRAPRYAESLFKVGVNLTPILRLSNDTRWAKYDATDLGLSRGYVTQFTELRYQISPAIHIAFGVGVDPWILDANPNEYAYIGRDTFLNELNANGYIAEHNWLSLAPQISAAEKRLKAEKRFQLQAVVHF